MAANERECIVDVLTGLAPDHPTGRIWGRLEAAAPEVAAEGNAWAADPEDLADLIVAALTRMRGW